LKSRKRFIKSQISGIVRQIEKTGKPGTALELVAELDFWFGQLRGAAVKAWMWIPVLLAGLALVEVYAVTKAEDDRDFKARWIPFGMRLKARADALGIDWRGLDLENYIAVISSRREMGAARRSARCVKR